MVHFHQVAKPVEPVSRTCTIKLVRTAEVRWSSKQLINYKDAEKELQ